VGGDNPAFVGNVEVTQSLGGEPHTAFPVGFAAHYNADEWGGGCGHCCGPIACCVLRIA